VESCTFFARHDRFIHWQLDSTGVGGRISSRRLTSTIQRLAAENMREQIQKRALEKLKTRAMLKVAGK